MSGTAGQSARPKGHSAPAPTPSTAPPATSVAPAADLAGELALAGRIISAQADAVRHLTTALGLAPASSAGASAFHDAVDLLERCSRAGGTVLVTGLGKSGLIGAKISATLASLGVASHFVHPAEAAHGDLGRFRPTDVCIALSASGETAEVVDLAYILRQDGMPIIAICKTPLRPAAPMPTLARLASVTLGLGPLDEEAAISPAPTLSGTATMVLGDALALCVSRRLAFTDSDFLRRHPGGSLGGLLRPVVEALRFTVGKNLVPAFDDQTVGEALVTAETPHARRPGALLLVDRASGRLTGLFTDADLRRLFLSDDRAKQRPIASVMTRGPGTLPSDALVRDAVKMVREFRRDEIPVVDPDGKPVGLLDVQDLIAMKLVRE